MSRIQMFFFGALGGLLPVLVSMVTVDLAPIIDHMNNLTPGNYIGYGIRVTGLVILGGTVAVLNSGVKEPFSLVQLGVAAPALITSFINGAPAASAQPTHASLAIVSMANADEAITRRRVQLAGGLLGDIVGGMGSRLDSLDSVNRAVGAAPPSPDGPTGPTYPPNYAPGAGAYCYIPNGRFGPGPLAPVGSPCQVTTPDGPVLGQVGK